VHLRLHARTTRIPEDATRAERPGPKFHPAVEPPYDLLICEQTRDATTDVVTLQPLVRDASRREERLDLIVAERGAQVGATHCVAPLRDLPRSAGLAVPYELRHAERTAGVTCRRLDPDVL